MITDFSTFESPVDHDHTSCHMLMLGLKLDTHSQTVCLSATMEVGATRNTGLKKGSYNTSHLYFSGRLGSEFLYLYQGAAILNVSNNQSGAGRTKYSGSYLQNYY